MTTATKSDTKNARTKKVVWTLTDSENGDAVEFGFFSDKSIQVEGDFDTATAYFEGSNDGTNYHTLTDPQGNALEFTSTGLEAVSEMTQWVRPRTGAGAGSVALTFTLFMKGGF